VPRTLLGRQANASLLTGPPVPGSFGAFADVPMFQTSHGPHDVARCSAAERSCSENTEWVTGLPKLGQISYLLHVAFRRGTALHLAE
jgi:hypothetical protein